MPVDSKQRESRTEWTSILIGTWMAFIAQVHFSLYFTSLWPFMKMLDSAASESFFGIVVAAYSLGQIIASPLLGLWANRIERVRPPLVLCNAMMLIGNLLYFLVEVFPGGAQKWILILARFVTGVGSAQIVLLRAYVSAASTLDDRARAIGFVTGGVAVGLSLGPAFQILFSGFGYPGFSLLPPALHLSMFNSPALFAALLCALNVVIVVQLFRESFVGIVEQRCKGNRRVEPLPTDCVQVQKPTEPVKLPPPDQLAIGLCYLIRFTQQFIITNLETIGSSFAMLMFLWTPHEVVFYEAVAHFARGFVAALVYLVYIVFDLSKFVNDRIVCLISLLSLLLFHIFTFSWPFLSNNVTGPQTGNTNSTIVGCDANLREWCDGLKQVNVWLYYSLMVLLVGTGFPLINVSMQTLFSKLIGPRMQAKEQGILQVSGSVARMLGPLMMGFLYTLYGPRAIWILECAVIVITFASWSIFFSRLVPFQMPHVLTNRISIISDTLK